ncbi:PAS domain-containing protein [Fibrella forsythiae]|uniref:PAS domain-containing protein n=1 Tax=Fibrella forsythiae TaxID=2817061 RepID=A0ABS3JRN3_9BACT|nr:PAS domain-containing protein [Fibrella forsythiae]MBO0951587.1 PAS domain-containing protein [Fibrella forsythiae]
MIFSQAYSDMQQQAGRSNNLDGQRSFPAPCMEIYLLTQAQQKARRKEAGIFGKLATIFDWQLTRKQRRDYLQALNQGFTLVLTDSSKTVLWASHSFLTMTGYTTSEAVGQTTKFLQGEQTSSTELNRINSQLQKRMPVKADLVNYRKNGEAYVCRLEIEPLRNSQGEFTHFLAVEMEVV